jgi:hypothetical protein
MNQDKSEMAAKLLIEFASGCGQINNLIRDLIDSDCEQVKEEIGAVDLLSGPEIEEISMAARSLAMRLDRAALIKFGK